MEILLGFVLVLAALLLLVFRFMKIQEKEQENRLIQDYMESLKSFYSIIQKRIEATRRYRHDLAKHIRTLEHMMQQENTEDMQEYVESLKDRYGQLRKEEYCRDEVVNSIVSLKMQQCQEKQIPFRLQIEDTVYSGVQEVDMVGLLYNLLDNAVEANERIGTEEEKGIFLSMGIQEQEIWIDIRNHICPGEKISFETKKADKEGHGIGTRIIDSLIDKYKGRKELSVDKDKHVFQKKIYLQMKG